MTTMPSASSTCRFPGCERPVAVGASTGRSPGYCDLPGHTRILAFKARKAEPVGDVAEDTTGPVTAAASRAVSLRDELVRLTGDLTARLEQVLGELTTMTDPAKVAAEIETVKATAAEAVAAAELEASRARGVEREAMAAKSQARRERREFEAVAAEAVEDLAAANAVHDEDVQSLVSVRDDLSAAVAKGEALAVDLTQVTGERDVERERAEDLTRQLTEVREQAAKAATVLTRTQEKLEQTQERFAEAKAHADRAETSRTEADQGRVAAMTEVAALRATLTVTERRVVDLVADVARLTATTLAATDRAAKAEERVEARDAAAAKVAAAAAKVAGGSSRTD